MCDARECQPPSDRRCNYCHGLLRPLIIVITSRYSMPLVYNVRYTVGMHVYIRRQYRVINARQYVLTHVDIVLQADRGVHLTKIATLNGVHHNILLCYYCVDILCMKIHQMPVAIGLKWKLSDRSRCYTAARR